MSKLLISFLGDDFTGSTDAMETLTLAGAKAVLFLDPPDETMLARFPGIRAVGVAGITRSMTPDEMASHLPELLKGLKALSAPIVQYKVCSTFDSSPATGSIGRVIDIARDIFPDAPFVPLLVAAPALGRYCLFGNLFATAGTSGSAYRLDRHPSMSRHPITPADESDLRVHLARQTEKRIALFDILECALPVDAARRELEAILAADRAEIVLFDTLRAHQLHMLGELISGYSDPDRPLFTVGSSGLDAALAGHWQIAETIAAPEDFADPGPAQPLLVVSGSCSPVTHQQIEWALDHDFVGVPLDTCALAEEETAEGALRSAIEAVIERLSDGQHVIVHTSRNEDDPRIMETREILQRRNAAPAQVLGAALGVIVRSAVARTTVRRVLIAGGDTSGYLARTLEIEAIEMIAPLTPGAPLCRAHARLDSPVNGLELNFKGGQVGPPGYFGDVARGALRQDPS